MCTWIHESDAELICMRVFFCFLFSFFLSDVLAYCVKLQAFDARACMCVCCSLALYSAIEHVQHGKAL